MRTGRFIRSFSVLAILIVVFLFFNCDCNDDKSNGWTVMIYGDGDNDLEAYLLLDIEEMMNGYVESEDLNLILLIDRISGYSSDTSVFGNNFTDTRLYKITSGTATRIGGGSQLPDITTSSNHEMNMGDANTLQDFVRFCKSEYSNDHYALILWNHGGGVKGKSKNRDGQPYKSVCWDDTSGGDYLYTAEISDVLTEDESVDLLGFDACFMGTVEVAYHFRPGNGGFNAQVMVASGPVVWGFGWNYENILSRLRDSNGDNGEIDMIVGSGVSNELYYDPHTMTTKEFAGIIVEEQYDSVQGETSQSLSSYDLTKVDDVKDAVDDLAVDLYNENEKSDFEVIRGSGSSPETMHYFNGADSSEWNNYPNFDLYDLCSRTSLSSNFSTNIRSKASNVMTQVDEMIDYSFGGSDFSGFANGQNGIHIFFPDGDNSYLAYFYWAYQWWYNSIDTNVEYGSGFYYGKLKWCIDGATAGNNTVENWFEMLDAWFDTGIPGYNAYSW